MQCREVKVHALSCHRCAKAITDTAELVCREALGRTGTMLLAQGSDGIKLQSQVQLLDEQEGQYMIGSVQFEKPGEALQRSSGTAQMDLLPGISSRPSLDSVLGSVRGQALMDSQVQSA